MVAGTVLWIAEWGHRKLMTLGLHSVGRVVD